ncbi:hypothetical protein KQX54_016438 [Cotesia glomerata]|uniref:Uncharacterized protein n=1 Tax=Cotesia glomerata TaxID=32391 RepID=A0AAV7HEA9_COTGL|nr:hypothetical protein KQX54_016438 [Cotesia glomerata]
MEFFNIRTSEYPEKGVPSCMSHEPLKQARPERSYIPMCWGAGCREMKLERDRERTCVDICVQVYTVLYTPYLDDAGITASGRLVFRGKQQFCSLLPSGPVSCTLIFMMANPNRYDRLGTLYHPRLNALR